MPNAQIFYFLFSIPLRYTTLVLKPEMLKVFGIVSAAIAGAAIIAGGLAYYVHVGPGLAGNPLKLIPASTVHIVTNSSTLPLLQQTGSGVQTAFASMPATAQYLFALEQNGNPIYGYITEIEQANTVLPNWNQTQDGKFTIVSSAPLPVPTERSVADLVANTLLQEEWMLLRPDVLSASGAVQNFAVNTDLLLSTRTHLIALQADEDALKDAIEFPILDGATRISMSQNALKYLAEPHRTLLTARLEYLWSKASGITDLPLDWWLQQGASTALQLEVEADGYVTVVGHSADADTLEVSLETLRTTPKTNQIEWEEVYRELDSFSHSTIQLKEQGPSDASGSTVQTVGNWQVEVSDGTLIAHNNEFWLVSNAPLELIAPALQSNSPRLLKDTVATGMLNANSATLLPLEFLPAGLIGEWELKAKDRNLELSHK